MTTECHTNSSKTCYWVVIISRFNVSFMYAIHSIKNEFAFLNIQGTVWFANFGSFEIIFYSASGSFAFKSVALIVEDHHISPSQVNNTRVFFFFSSLQSTLQNYPNLFLVMDSIWTTLTILVILAIFNAHMHLLHLTGSL